MKGMKLKLFYVFTSFMIFMLFMVKNWTFYGAFKIDRAINKPISTLCFIFHHSGVNKVSLALEHEKALSLFTRKP